MTAAITFGITRRQREVLTIYTDAAARGEKVSMRDVAYKIGSRSHSLVHGIVERLVERGHLVKVGQDYRPPQEAMQRHNRDLQIAAGRTIGCPSCTRKFKTNGAYLQHWRDVHDTGITPTPEATPLPLVTS